MITNLPVISLEALEKLNDRPERTIQVPAWGASVVIREPDTRTDVAIMRSCMVGEKENQALDNEEFAVKQIIEGFVAPKLGPQHAEMIKGWGAATCEYLVSQIRNRKKNEPMAN